MYILLLQKNPGKKYPKTKLTTVKKKIEPTEASVIQEPTISGLK